MLQQEQEIIQKIKEEITKNYELIDKIPILDKCIEIGHLEALCYLIYRMVSDTVFRDIYFTIKPLLKENELGIALTLEQLAYKYADLTKENN